MKLNQIREKLLKQKQKVEKEIKDLEADDPIMANDVAESSEPGMESWLADGHSRTVALKMGLQKMLTTITKSLKALNTGKYGKCENCGKKIEAERLNVMPTAVLCIACSKKA